MRSILHQRAALVCDIRSSLLSEVTADITGRLERVLSIGSTCQEHFNRNRSLYHTSDNAPEASVRGETTIKKVSHKDVPLGSKLHVACHGLPVNVLLVNGNMEELILTVEEAHGGLSKVSATMNTTAGAHGSNVYSVQCTSSSSCEHAPIGRIIAEIPPRYFGIDVKTSGSVVVHAGIKEAQSILIETETGGDITCQGALSADSIRLESLGAGSIETSTIMANKCSLITKSSQQGHISAPMTTGRLSCLNLDVDAGVSAFHADSLLSSNAHVRAGSITAKNVNTLDGQVHFDVVPSHSSNVSVGGMDGTLRIDVLPSTRKVARPVNIDIQLNDNAKSLHIHGSAPTITTSLYASDILDVEVESGEKCTFHRRADGSATNMCKVVSPPKSRISVNRRSWFEAFRQSTGYEDTQSP